MMKVVPRTIAGGVSYHNKGAFEWSSCGLIAYGSSTTVAVVDSSTLQHVTTLHAHRSAVTKIAWAPSNSPIDEEQEHLYLTSADTSGFIILFDVTAGKAKQKMSETNKVVNAMEMLYVDYTELCLITLHQPAVFILWSVKSANQIWKKSFTDAMTCFTRDPFNSGHLVLNGGMFIQLITDFCTNQAPSDGTRLYLSSSSQTDGASNQSPLDRKSKSAGSLLDMQRRTKVLIGDKTSKSAFSDEENFLTNLQNVFYHKTRRNTLILAYNQDVLILDLDIRQTISVISLERSTCPFVQIYPCWSRDAIFCLHDNGTVVLRVKKQNLPSISVSDDDYAPLSPRLPEFVYESHCSSDGMRITKNQKIFGLSVCPISELKAAVITSEGKLLKWELLGSLRAGIPSIRPVISLSDLLKPSTSGSLIPIGVKFSFLLTGITNSLPQPPYVVRMCPPLTTKNFHIYQPHLAVGTLSGVVQVYNIQTGALVRDLTVHGCQVRGVEWASLCSLVTHACETLNGSQGRSELAYINVNTGKVTNFRQSKPDEGVIQAVRISYLRNKSMELWELKSLTLLREMPPDFPVITALEWSPNVKKKPSEEGHGDAMTSPNHMAKEHFVLTDNTGMLYHFIVEGSLIKDGSKINAEGVSGTVSSLAWKYDLMVLGDVNSNLSFWDLKSKKSKNMAMNKGMVRKIRFAPGKDNSKILILFNEEVQIWDKNTQQVVSSLQFPKEIGRVNDVDWAASDKVVLTVADGYVTITDVSLHMFMSPLLDLINTEESTLPGVLSPSSLAQQYSICCHPWSDNYQIPSGINFDIEVKDYLMSSSAGILEKCLITSYVCGDKFSVEFWTIANYYINRLKEANNQGNSSISQSETSTVEKCEIVEHNESMEPLESNYDIFCDCVTFKNNELARVQLQDNKKYGAETRLECARRYILLGKFDRAIHLLLESESECSTFYSDSLRACLLATVRSSGTSQSTIKLVATSLIAHEKLTDGVELLCLIDKSLDACRYLQTYGQWNEAVWLAKATLTHQDCTSVISRWVTEYLCLPNVNQKHQALLAALSIGDLVKATELLYSLQCFSLAAMFVEASIEAGVLKKNEKNLPVIEAVFLQYAKRLRAAEIIEGSVYYAKQAGEQGAQLLTELEDSSKSN